MRFRGFGDCCSKTVCMLQVRAAFETADGPGCMCSPTVSPVQAVVSRNNAAPNANKQMALDLSFTSSTVHINVCYFTVPRL